MQCGGKRAGEFDRIGSGRTGRLLFESEELLYLSRQTEKLISPYVVAFASEWNIPMSPLSYCIEYIVSGTLDVLHSWICSRYPIDVQDVKHILVFWIGTTEPFRVLTQMKQDGYISRPN